VKHLFHYWRHLRTVATLYEEKKYQETINFLKEVATDFPDFKPEIYYTQMAAAIKQRIRDELRLCASIGIASGKVVAKVASELSKPDGLLEVAAGEERSFLAPLPIAKLPGIGKKTERILNSLGINTIGETIYYALKCA